MYKYKLVKRGNPQNENAPKKWYASPLSETAQDVKAMTRAATENTTVAPKSRPGTAGQLCPPAIAAGPHGAPGRLRHAAHHLPERGRGKHHRLSGIEHDQEPAHPLHAQQGVPRVGHQQPAVRERRCAGRRRQLRLAGRLQEGEGHHRRHHHRAGRQQWRRHRAGRRRPVRMTKGGVHTVRNHKTFT